jgi:hypothetical protein
MITDETKEGVSNFDPMWEAGYATGYSAGFNNGYDEGYTAGGDWGLEAIRATNRNRRPLSEDQIFAAIKGVDSLRAVEVARAIEHAHGITEHGREQNDY